MYVHKIKQKPGKPFYFGRYKQTLVFALPGNPAAVMSCFYEYVVQAISSFTQKEYFKKMAFPLAEDFNKKAGLTFCYHNHDAEFKMIDGQRAFDVFSNEIPADLMKFELDLGWASKAGEDPVALFAQQPGRFPLCHLKDFDADFKNIVPVGTGIINYKRILEASSKGGIEHFFVEHDMPKDAFESLRLAKTNLDAIL